MPVSSLIVRTEKDRGADVAEAISAIAGARVSDRIADRLVVVTETESHKEDGEIWEKLENSTGVIGVNLVYYNLEDLAGGVDG